MANNNAVSSGVFGGLADLVNSPNRQSESAYANNSLTAGLNYNDKQYASEVSARITRKDWQDYQRTFIPVHGEFKQAVMSDDLINQQVARIEDNVNATYDRTQKGAEMKMQRMGLSDVDTGRSDLSKALSVAHGENAARQHGEERKQQMIAGANISPQSARAN